MAKSCNQKIKLLYLMKAFLEKTDEMHPLTMPQLIEELEKYQIHAERKSIYDDLEALRLYGMDILCRKERPSGYYLASREFELPELKILVDVVQSSKFLTVKKSTELIRKLEGLASRYEAAQLQRQVVVKNRIKTMNETIYYNVDKIHTAISGNRAVTFQYFEWTPEKEMKKKREGNLYLVSPWVLLWEDENYYMVGFDSRDSMVKHFRVDKMLSITVTKKKREGKEFFEHFDMAEFSRKTFGMYHGHEEDVRLQLENRLIGVVIDRFGREIPVRSQDENSFITRLKVTVSAPFFGWLATLGAGVEILSPQSVREEYITYLQKVLKIYDGASEEKWNRN